jgi:hypothetical protein
MKISNAPAVKREAEEESGKKRGENHDLGARGPFCLTLQNGGASDRFKPTLRPPSKAQEPFVDVSPATELSSARLSG